MLRFFFNPKMSFVDKLKQHLPPILYNFLEEHYYLARKDHNIQQGKTLSFTLVEGEDDAEMVSVEVHDSKDNVETIFLFSNQSWHLLAITSDDDYFIEGNIKSVPVTGLSDADCIDQTSKYVECIIELLNRAKQEDSLAYENFCNDSQSTRCSLI